MIYGYARVSTAIQAKDGNSLEIQEKLMREHGATKIFYDVYTGVKNDRPQLQILLKKLKKGDTVLVTKLDRIARSVKEGVELIESLIKKGITVNILNLGVMSNSATGQLVRNILLSIAQFERDMIIERTREGREVARRNPDYREGRPKKFSRKQISHALGLLENHTYREVIDMTGISKGTLIRYKNEENAKLLKK